MFRKLVIILGLCSLMTACGPDTLEIRTVQAPPAVLVQNTPNISLPIPTTNYIIVKRGYYTNCRGYITGVYYSYSYGKVYNINPLTCGRYVYYNVQIEESLFL